MIPFKKNSIAALVLLSIATTFLSGCRDNRTAVSITAYNHMKDLSIAGLYVNGVMGPNASADGGGGAETCCILLPNIWRPGLTVKIWWEYDGMIADLIPPPPPAEISVPIPEYKTPDKLQIHFYKDRIKIVVSPCSPYHPFYPMSKEDLAPWEASGTKQSMAETARRGGGSIDC